MKKFILIGMVAAAAIALAAFSGVAYVAAQAPTPNGAGTGWGRGTMMGGGFMATGGQPMAETMHAALAEKLGLSEQAFEDALAQGQTAWQLAEAQGLTAEEFTSLMADARSAALAQMVADGTITQDQADWMATRGGAMMGGAGGAGYGSADCPMFDDNATAGASFSGARGRGRGMMGGNR